MPACSSSHFFFFSSSRSLLHLFPASGAFCACTFPAAYIIPVYSHISFRLPEKHKLRFGTARARDQETDYWLQIARVVSERTHKHAVPALSGGLKRELRPEPGFTYRSTWKSSLSLSRRHNTLIINQLTSSAVANILQFESLTFKVCFRRNEAKTQFWF